ncbi:hypothetical protein [Actinomadura craniellae]|uniref:hypothetical protein n=1 Tax=Actinomadura craniellae TaxID=2231787 RepID=UPI001313EE6E|nr:hypothetical protein [Actinomadura craniellae]
MRSRLARGPLLAGLGATAILAAGGVWTPAHAATLLMSLSVADRSLQPGDSTSAVIRVLAGSGGPLEGAGVRIGVTAPATVTLSCGGSECALGEVGTGGTSVTARVSIPSWVKKPTSVSLSATASAGNAPAQSRSTVLSVTVPAPPPPPPSPKPPAPKPSKTASPAPRGSTPPAASGGVAGGPPSLPGAPPPLPGMPGAPLPYSGPVPAPGVSLPAVAALTPSVASGPAGPGQPGMVLRAGTSPAAADPVVLRLAWLHAAWLAVLLAVTVQAARWLRQLRDERISNQ